MTYKFLSHTADVKFQASGKTLEEAFEQSALALRETISGNLHILEQETHKIQIKATDLSNLLYKFLEEFLFLLDSKQFLFSKINKIQINQEEFSLEATISGDQAKNYKFTNDVKAITYNNMFVKNQEGIWLTQVVLDV